jgi:hypothetical protein
MAMDVLKLVQCLGTQYNPEGSAEIQQKLIAEFTEDGTGNINQVIG